MPIRYKNGLKMKVMCYRCGTKVPATIYQQRIRWIAKLECPHAKKHMGYTMPQDELIKKQLVSTDNSRNDPRVKATREQAEFDIQQKEAEHEAYRLRQKDFTRPKYM